MTKYAIYQPHNAGRYLDDHNELIIPFLPVVIIEAETLDEIFHRTQHSISPTKSKTGNWVGDINEGIMPIIRSSMVGDIYYDIKAKKAWVVENVGFNEYTGTNGFDYFK